MAGTRVAVVTGGNKGIGYEIAKQLANGFEGLVYLTARDEERGQKAAKALSAEGLCNVKFHQLDIDDSPSIDRLSDFIKAEHGGIDVLVNNAATAFKMAATEPFAVQAEVTLKTNYWSTVAVCKSLFPLLRPHARVVNVSSSAGHLKRINGKEPEAGKLRARLSSSDLTEEELGNMMEDFVRHAKAGTYRENGWPGSTYVVSKVGVSALTRIQQRLFDSDPRADIIVNSVHPGYVITDMTSGKGDLTAAQGAVAPTYLALLPPETKSPKGGYVWYNKKEVDWEKDL